MKYLLIIPLFLARYSFAQLNLPELSPEAKIHQQVGYTTFDIRYGRPAVRERKIMGDLVPYGKLWRTGAGKCTTFSFDQDVVINNKTIPSGIYSVATIPGEKEWIVMLNADTSKIYGVPEEYDIRNEVFRFSVTPEKASRFYESLTIDIDVVRDDAVIYLTWENTQIHFQIKTGAHEQTLAEIHNALQRDSDNQDILLMAAWRYYMDNESSEQALKWVEKVLSKGDDRWAFRLKVDLLERMKNYKEARKTAMAAIQFLKTTKPDAWSEGMLDYEMQMKKWPNF
jgi:tetratricopeptide (TPR) repeat protein